MVKSAGYLITDENRLVVSAGQAWLSAVALSFMSDLGYLLGERTMVGPSTTVIWPVRMRLILGKVASGWSCG